jgi:hypothetical protein
MVIKGKHKEILIELLIYYLTNRKFSCKFTPDEINNIKEQNEAGQWHINYYIDKWDKLP